VLQRIPCLLEGLHGYPNLVRHVDLWRLRYIHALALLGCERYREALDQLERILDGNDRENRRHLMRSTRIFTLILYYELGELDLLSYRVAALRRLLKRRNDLFRFERVFLGFLRKLPDLTEREETRLWFEEMYGQLDLLRNDPLERAAFDDFNYMAWLRSKIDGIGLSEAIRKELQTGPAGAG